MIDESSKVYLAIACQKMTRRTTRSLSCVYTCLQVLALPRYLPATGSKTPTSILGPRVNLAKQVRRTYNMRIMLRRHERAAYIWAPSSACAERSEEAVRGVCPELVVSKDLWLRDKNDDQYWRGTGIFAIASPKPADRRVSELDKRGADFRREARAGRNGWRLWV